jgi:hypothetical protein
MAPSPIQRSPPMRFVFLRPGLCLGLPPYAASRWPHLPSARGSRHRAPRGLSPPSHFPVDFHLLVIQRQLRRCVPCLAHHYKVRFADSGYALLVRGDSVEVFPLCVDGLLFVMLLLIENIATKRWCVRFAQGERTIPGLPAEEDVGS